MIEAEFIARADRFGTPGLLKRSVFAFPGSGAILDRVLGDFRDSTVLEIGTYRGVSAAYIATRCKSVVTIDLSHGQLERDGETFDRYAFWKHMGADNIELLLVEDDAEKASAIATLEFDLAFIDGGAVNVADDFALVSRCGAVLFHDYDKVKTRKVVYDFVNALPPAEIEVMGMFALWRG